MTIKIQAPVQVDIKVHFTDGKHAGEVTIGFRIGKVPTDKEIRERIAKFEREELPKLLPGATLMTKRQFWDQLCMENYGERFALPGGEEFDD